MLKIQCRMMKNVSPFFFVENKFLFIKKRKKAPIFILLDICFPEEKSQSLFVY